VIIESLDVKRSSEYLSGARKTLPKLCYEVDDNNVRCHYCMAYGCINPDCGVQLDPDN
jgi:hypothetical protein